ncbi:MAG: BON domain-containing protein [Pseudomonadota bacterium]
MFTASVFNGRFINRQFQAPAPFSPAPFARAPFAMAALTGLALLATGCTPAGTLLGAGATVGVAAAQERTVGAALDDTVISTRISERWFRHSEPMFLALDLTVVEGRVLITGTLKDADLRVDAVRLAWQVPGVHEVINEIQLTDESEGIRGFARDVRIANELRAKLTFDREVSAVNYSVDTVGGVIYLMGVAQNQAELERVVGHARNIESVRRVVSYVRLRDQAIPGQEGAEQTAATPIEAPPVNEPGVTATAPSTNASGFTPSVAPGGQPVIIEPLNPTR